MNNLCRLCANTKPLNRLTIRISDSILNVEEKLIACCQWEKYRDNDDNLPDAICFECYDKLEESWHFSNAIGEAQEALRKMLYLRFPEHELKAEDNEFDNKCETELENINIFVEPSNSITLEEPLDLDTIQSDETIGDGRQPLPRHLKNTDRHQTTHSNEILESVDDQSDEFKYACNECGCRFRSRGTLNAHRLVHSHERPFECWLCHKT